MTSQTGNADREERCSQQELDFMRRWRQLVDQAGGQSVVARKLNWATSTVSRDYNGDPLPRKERLLHLCRFLGLSGQETDELLGLLERARAARRARPKGEADEADQADQADQHKVSSVWRSQLHIPVWVAAVTVGLIVVLLGVIAWAWPEGSTPGPVVASQSPHVSAAASAVPQPGPEPTGGPYPGLTLKAIAIPLASLQAPLRKAFGRNRSPDGASVTGYEFRDSGNTGLCLGATVTGARAGEDYDPVRAWNCSLAANEIWIPEQWELHGSRFTWLVNYQYQSKCLNAADNGRMNRGSVVQLWGCYDADNESWDFGDWYNGLKAGASSYPIFVKYRDLCLDADKYDLRDGTTVLLWNQYPTASQFWS